MTKNEKYWQVRTAQRMWEHMQSAEETADQVAKVYAKASLYLSREMQDIFKKYVEKHHLKTAPRLAAYGSPKKSPA